jgi:uncharacterized protein with FMN-binding domain
MRTRSLRRAALTTAGTVSGVVLLLALKIHSASHETGNASPGAATPTVATDSSTSLGASPSPLVSDGPEQHKEPSTSPTVSSPTASESPAAAPPKSTATSTSTRNTDKTSAAPATQTVTGNAVSTKYGPVQVEITLSGEKITEASAVQCPSELPRSQELCATAVPQLNDQAIATQSADIDAVSGATYTSEGYIGSLQSAIDAAGI